MERAFPDFQVIHVEEKMRHCWNKMFLEKSHHRSELPVLVLLAGQSTPVTQVVKSSETLSLEKHGTDPVQKLHMRREFWFH